MRDKDQILLERAYIGIYNIINEDLEAFKQEMGYEPIKTFTVLIDKRIDTQVAKQAIIGAASDFGKIKISEGNIEIKPNEGDEQFNVVTITPDIPGTIVEIDDFIYDDVGLEELGKALVDREDFQSEIPEGEFVSRVFKMVNPSEDDINRMRKEREQLDDDEDDDEDSYNSPYPR